MWDFEHNESIWSEMDEIINVPDPFKAFFLLGTILHTAEKDLNEDDGVLIASMDVKRDYIESTADTTLISLLVSPGTFVYDIYPYADDLELTLTRYRQKISHGEMIKHDITYKAIFRLDQNQELPTTPSGPKDIMNRTPPLNLVLELVDKGDLAVRNKTVQGAFNNIVSETNKDMSGSSILKSLLTKISSSVKIDGGSAIERVMIEESQNKTPLENLLIPTGTSGLNIANYIQENGGGLYTAGCNNYIQHYAPHEDMEPERTMFVYSLYDGSKFEEAENKMVILIPPSNDYNVVERTYKYAHNVLKVFSNPVDGLVSTKDAVLRSQGDGFRTASSESIMKIGVELKKGIAFFKKTATLTEIADKIRDDGTSYVPYKGISNNHFTNTTDVLSRKGQYIPVIINNLDPDFIYPGAVQLRYQIADGLISEMVGVIHNVEIKYNYEKFDIVEERTKQLHGLTTTMFLNIYITGPEPEENGF